uniref:Biliverdin reductase A n=1 Tax=Fundulus heteroclitus TaxID=8078 RepID=A0A3Q2TF44_FUNHE
MFGAVVVGVGIAGGVRIRDMLNPLPGSGAEKNLSTLEDVNQISVEEAMNRKDIRVAFICTENDAHEDFVRMFLEAGKHVCVEYPMTLSYKTAVELWVLAQTKGLILHEEHIELLTEDYKQLKKEVAGKVLLEGSLHFTGGSLKPGFGFPAFSGIARLCWLVDLFGELSVTGANFEQDAGKGYIAFDQFLVTGRNLSGHNCPECLKAKKKKNTPFYVAKSITKNCVPNTVLCSISGAVRRRSAGHSRKYLF